MRTLCATATVALLLLAGCEWMTLSPPTHPLQRTWELKEFDGRDVLVNLRPTLTFAADGAVSGSGGCNLFHGPVTISGNAIHFGTLVMTRRACADVVMDQEQRYFQALGRAATWKLNGDSLRDTLIIAREGGAAAMRFAER